MNNDVNPVNHHFEITHEIAMYNISYFRKHIWTDWNLNFDFWADEHRFEKSGCILFF